MLHSRFLLVIYFIHQFSSLQLLRHVRLFATPLTATRQTSLSITSSRNLLKFKSIGSVMPFNHLVLCLPFSCLQSFPASGSFPISQFFESGGPSIGVSASASVLPVNTQAWSPLGKTSWIFSLPGDSLTLHIVVYICQSQFLDVFLSLLFPLGNHNKL